MKHVATVAARELQGLFVSPVAYGVLSLFAVLAGFFFILGVAWFSDVVVRAQQFQAFDFLAELNPSAARSLQEGLEETLTLHRLGVPER